MELKAGYKQTEVGMIPDDWDFDYIENLAHITTGGRNTQDRVDDGQYPFFVRSQIVERINSYSFDGEAVLTAGDGVGTGKVFHYVNGKFDAHQRVYRISEFRERINGYFFYLYFSSHFYNRIMQMTAKSSVDSVRREMIARMVIPIPPTKAEQEAIATALSDVDALITALDRLIAKKRDIKQAAMQELLTGKRRLPGFCEEWTMSQIGEITDVDPDSLGCNTAPDYAFKYISIEDIDSGTLKGYTEMIYHSAPSRARRKVKKNDILFSTVRPNLKSNFLIKEECSDFICSTGFSVLRCKPEKADPVYVYFHLFADDVGRQIESLIAGSNYPAVNSSDVRALHIPLPPLSEQRAIASVLSDMETEIITMGERLKKTRTLKQGMMQELLTGRIRLVQGAEA
jgi:type I restriction enzyme S subunit